jgi:ATP-dependent Zn protease
MNRNFRNNQDSSQNRGLLGRSRSWIWLILLIVLAIWLWSTFGGTSNNTQIPYNTFRQQVESGNVQQITVSGEKITGKLKQPAETTI